MIDPGTVYMVVKAAGMGIKGQRALDKYAAEHGLNRGEALKLLAEGARQRGDKAMTNWAQRSRTAWDEEVEWQKAHPVQALVTDVTLPGARLMRVVGKTWLRKRA